MEFIIRKFRLSNGETVPMLLWQTTTWTMLHQRLDILYPSYTFSTHNDPASFVVDGDISDIYIPVIGKRKYSSISPPSHNEVKTFDTHTLIEHLHDYGIVCDHTVLNVLINEKIAGQSFLLQTTESLKLCGISLDTATTITEYINEINANDPSRVSKATMATKRVSEFNSKWHDHPRAILVSPPYSGKTTFGSALKQFLENKGRKVISISMKLVLSNDGLYAKSKDCFDMFWIDQTEISWSDILECTDQTDVIIDDADMLFRIPMLFLWPAFHAYQRNPNLRILVLCQHGRQLYPTEIIAIAEPVFGLADLRLTRHELDTVVDGIQFSNDVIDATFNVTNGHPALASYIFNHLKTVFSNDLANTTAILEYMLSAQFFDEITKCDALKDQLGIHCKGPFVAPVIDIVRQQMASPTIPSHTIDEFRAFICECVSRMRPSALDIDPPKSEWIR
ncbi:hypothetical protein BC936DRAFT_149462, partial [Jimgerdemannia flammicorona]